MPETKRSSRARLKVGELWIDQLTFDGALDAIEDLVREQRGGFVFTPNIDHVVMADVNDAFRDAYAAADLSLVDGKPLLWASSLLGVPLPEKVSGADIIVPLAKRCARNQWSIYLFGAGPGVAERAGEVLSREHGVKIAGVDSPKVLPDGTCDPEAIERIRAARPHVLLAALGAPKQELWIHRHAEAIRPAVSLGIGAGLDFIAGTVKRAPKWMSNAGLEWFFRLSQEPKRLWRRYLVNDPKFLAILVRSLRRPAVERRAVRTD